MKGWFRTNKNKEKNGNEKTTFSISTKILLLLVFSVAAAVFFITVYVIGISKQVLVSNTEATLLDLVNTQSKDIDKSIEAINATMSYLDTSEDLFNFQGSKGKKLVSECMHLISKYMEKNSNYENFSVLGADGKVMLSSDQSLLGKDYSSEAFVKKIVGTNSPAQSNVFFMDGTEEPVITVGIPQLSYYNKNEVIGIFAATVKVSLLSDIIAEIKVLDSKNSYAYLLDGNGTYIYEPDAEMIGTKTNNKKILHIVTELNQGKAAETEMFSDSYGGKNQYVCYYISPVNDWILCMVIEENEVLSPIRLMMKNGIIISLITVLVLSFVGYLFSRSITTPIKIVTRIIQKTASFDLLMDETYHKIRKNKDETGEMSNALYKMRESFRQMMKDIYSTSESISGNADDLYTIANTVNENACDNSSTGEQLAACMEQSAGSSQMITDEVGYVKADTDAIRRKAMDGLDLSNIIMQRAAALKENAMEAECKTKNMYVSVKAETEDAMIRSRAVSKINDLSKTIMDIAEQTSLLSLNASIEAARAGEAGKGFSVVAGEIRHLAAQSTSTVEHITEIVKEVNDAVNKMAESLVQTLSFLDKNVLSDYADFMEVSRQYQQDAVYVNETMNNIHGGVDRLNNTMSKITMEIGAINTAVNESAVGVENEVERNKGIEALTAETYHKVKETMNYSDSLKKIVGQFRL